MVWGKAASPIHPCHTSAHRYTQVMQFFSGAASFQPSSAPFQPASPVKMFGASSYAARLTPTRPERQPGRLSAVGDARKRLFTYAKESQNTTTSSSDGSYNTDSFSPTQYSYQLGFGSNSDATADTRYGGDPYVSQYDSSSQRLSPVYYTQMPSSSPPTIQEQQHPPLPTREKPQPHYPHYFRKQDHYQHQQQQLQQPHSEHNHTLREQNYGHVGQNYGRGEPNYGRGDPSYGRGEPNYGREQKQRSLSEGMEEERQWQNQKHQQQEQQRQQYQQHQQRGKSLHKRDQMSHGEEKTSSLSPQWPTTTTTISRDRRADTTVSFLKQHDEKPPRALIAWERFSASRRN